MKKLSLRIISLVVAAAIGLLFLTGCDLFGKDSKDEEDVKKYDYLFKNDSSYTVSVQPDGQTTWTAFTLSPGSTKTITIPDSKIRFIYDQANYILCDNSVAGKLRFYNRTLLAIKNSSSADLDFIQWRGYYFGKDLVWDALLGSYVYGLKPGSTDVREVTPGSGYVYTSGSLREGLSIEPLHWSQSRRRNRKCLLSTIQPSSPWHLSFQKILEEIPSRPYSSV